MTSRGRYQLLRRVAVLVAMVYGGLLAAVEPCSAQTPFYLTFERSFSPTEETELRIDYTDNEQPFHVRVLRPKNPELFLEGQLQISRSYEEPRAALNPGYYLGEGLNDVKSPLQGFRRLLSPEFRQQWNGLLSPPLRTSVDKEAISTPKRVVHEPPVGFEVVVDLHLDLQKGGTRPDDRWWWFFNQAPSGSTYTVRTVTLGKLPVGLFLVQAVQGDNEGQALLQVSDASVQVKQSSRELAVRVINRKGEALTGVEISARDGSGKWSAVLGTTNEFGEALVRGGHSDFDGKLVVRAQLKDGTFAFSDTDFVPIAPAPESMFIHTDRPIFKPGEEVYFKGVVRELADGTHKAPATSNVKVSLQRQDGSVAGTLSQVTMTQMGSVSGKLSLSEVDPPGLYRLVADVAGKPYAGELRVRDYVKPTFYLELTDSKGLLRSGESFNYTLKAKRYAGGAPSGGRYEVYVYRKKFETPQFVDEGGGGLTTGSDYFGGAQSATSLSQPQRIYSSIEERTPESERANMGEAWSTAATFDSDGIASGSITLPPIPADNSGKDEWTYSLMFRAMDGAGSTAVLSKDYYQTLSPGVVTVRFSKATAQPGEEGIKANVRVTAPEGDGLGGISGEIELLLNTVKGGEKIHSSTFTTNDSGYATISVPSIQGVGALRAKARALGKGTERWTVPAVAEDAELLVIGANGEAVRSSTDVALFTDSTIVSPGEQAKVFAILPDNWGVENSGVIWRAIAGTKVYSTSANKVSGRSYSFTSEAKEEYGTGYFETLTVPTENGKFREATLGFRIIPWKKRLKVAVAPEREIGEPMRPFVVKALVTHADGSPAAGSEVAIAIVDKAVYAVQPEFRPSIFDFFFPMPRLNLMTFYSDELQGYGYADMIKKPNFSLSALKSQAKLSKRTARDTAGWYPHLIANEHGEVSVTVPMPSNLTEWVVTATAVDAGGKVGEGTGLFRTAVDVEVEPRVPQFVREGDSITLPMAVLNHSTDTVRVSANLRGAQGDRELGAIKADGIELTSGARKSVELSLSGAAGKTPVYLEAALSLPEKSDKRAGGAREFEVSSLPVTESVSVAAFEAGKEPGSTKLDLPVPEGARVNAVTIHVSRGLLGLVLANAKELVSYPYGCAEQLAHSTFPNIALMKISDGVPEAHTAYKELGPLVAKAKTNATIGIKRILAHQKPSGGFSLWPSDKEESPVITAMVMQVLQAASDAGVTEASNPLWKAATWLESVADSQKWTLYELLLLPTNTRATEVAMSGVQSVKGVINNPAASFSQLVFSAELVAKFADMSWHTFTTNLAKEFPGTNVLEKLQDRIRIAVEKNAFDGKVPALEFSDEELGFAPGALSVYASAYRILPAGDTKYSKARDMLKAKIFRDVRTGLAMSPFDRGRLIEAILPSVIEDLSSDKEELEGVSVKMTGRDAPITLSGIPGGATATLSFADSEVRGPQSIVVTGVMDESVVGAVATAEIPFEKLKDVNYGMTISRILSKVTPSGRTPLKPGDAISVGDMIVSEIRVERNGTPLARTVQGGGSLESPSDWVSVSDAVPSLAEVVDNDRTVLADAKVAFSASGAQPSQNGEDYEFWGLVKETLRFPDRTERVVKLRPGEKFTSYSVWRASFKGTATVPPAEVIDMYSGSYRAASEVVEVTVR